MRHVSKLGLLITLITLLGACSDAPDSDVDAGLIDIIDVGETPFPDADEPDADEPDADEPDADEPDADEPDADEPDADEPDADEPDADEPDADQPDANEPDADEPDADQPDADEPDADEPDADEPDADEPDADEPDTDPEYGWSCAPDLELDSTRYTHLEGVSDQDLIDGLFLLVDGHTGYGYTEARDFMYAPVTGIDTQPDGFIHCPYTGRLATAVPPPNNRTPDGFNTEHSWPRSDGAGSFPAEGDIHHLYPTWAPSNTARGNYEFGNTNCTSNCSWQEGGSKLGPGTDGRSPVFEVRPENRGDIARAHFYFSVRYGLPIAAQEEAVLRQWHCQDPPDDWERLRNDRVEVVQQNRNPFIDRPDFVDQIANF